MPPVVDEQVAAIEKCIENGMLRRALRDVDLATGRFGESWLYG